MRQPLLTNEDIDFILSYLDPALDDEDEGKQVFAIMRKLMDMKGKKDLWTT